MNDANYTQNGDRPDLAALDVLKPEGFIGDSLIPVVPVADKSGTVYYATVNADSAAQTGRVAGAAPNSSQISDSNTTFTCAEICKRYGITPDEVKQMGGIAKADAIGGKASKRSVLRAREAAACTAILGIAKSATFDAQNIQSDMQTALDAIEQYDGRRVMVAATATLKKIVKGIILDQHVGPLFSRIVTGGNANVAMEGLALKAWADALAMFLGVDEVKAGVSGIWNAAAVAGKFAVLAVSDDPDPLSHKSTPVFAKNFQFLPDGSTPWVVKSIADLTLVNNFYDAYVWENVVTMNSGAAYVFDGAV